MRVSNLKRADVKNPPRGWVPGWRYLTTRSGGGGGGGVGSSYGEMSGLDTRQLLPTLLKLRQPPYGSPF